MNLHPLLRPPYLDDRDESHAERARRVAARAALLGHETTCPKKITPRVKALFRELRDLRDFAGDQRWAAAAEVARAEYAREVSLAKAEAEWAAAKRGSK